ncbi:hypothetical protein EVAR_25364_1 [Eumeta japonica]|uniref:Uncharacterized protein n=1 Tax=Eumeta variegata TaxID=151549 RepID=A0A4C1XWJ6_EUMVA|nr:hypothetical protein EVAR_25364_1 [Eumeta japonica]
MLTDEFKEGRPKSVVVPQNIDDVGTNNAKMSCCISRDKGVPGLNSSKAVYDIYTGAEPWIYAYDPETKQSPLYVFRVEPNPTKLIRAKSTLKQMSNDVPWATVSALHFVYVTKFILDHKIVESSPLHYKLTLFLKGDPRRPCLACRGLRGVHVSSPMINSSLAIPKRACACATHGRELERITLAAKYYRVVPSSVYCIRRGLRHNIRLDTSVFIRG